MLGDKTSFTRCQELNLISDCLKSNAAWYSITLQFLFDRKKKFSKMLLFFFSLLHYYSPYIQDIYDKRVRKEFLLIFFLASIMSNWVFSEMGYAKARKLKGSNIF